MKKLTPCFSRVTALLLLVTFSFTSCFSPLHLQEQEIVVITPGEGNPKYVYIDSEGNASETDTGRTALFIENNKNAEGALVVADKYDEYDRVMVYNPDNGSVVSMFFKPDSNFPYQMRINYGDQTYFAHLSKYREASSSYDIVFQSDGASQTLYNLILNKGILNLYQDDSNLDASQNLRLRNITIALGLWGSIAASLEEKNNGPAPINLSWGDFLGGLREFFNVVKIVAVVVAVIVAPIVSLINPAVGEILFQVATVVFVLSDFAIGAITDALDDNKPQYVPSALIVIVRKNNGELFKNGEEFHIGKDKELVLNFTIPGLDNKSISLNHWAYYDLDEIIIDNIPTSNKTFFERTMEKNGNSDEFQMRFRRIIKPGFIGEGKIAFGIKFTNDSVGISVNDSKEPVLFKLFGTDDEETAHNDMVVVRFCIYPECPDYVY